MGAAATGTREVDADAGSASVASAREMDPRSYLVNGPAVFEARRATVQRVEVAIFASPYCLTPRLYAT
jgi:hypothetical protein